MAFYRFPPPLLRGTLLAVSGCVLAVLALPAIISATITLPKAPLEKVTIAAPGSQWEVPVPDLYCTSNNESMATQAWNCGDITVQAVLQQGVDDGEREKALRRAIRGYSLGSVSSAEVFTQDRGLALFDDPTATTALFLAGEGDNAGQDYILLIGPNAMDTSFSAEAPMLGDIQRISERLWRAFGYEELPRGLVNDLQDALPAGATPPQMEEA